MIVIKVNMVSSFLFSFAFLALRALPYFFFLFYFFLITFMVTYTKNNGVTRRKKYCIVRVLYNRVPVKVILNVICRKRATHVEAGLHDVSLTHYSVVSC